MPDDPHGLRTEVEAFLDTFAGDSDDAVIKAVGDRKLAVGHLRGLLCRLEPQPQTAAVEAAIERLHAFRNAWQEKYRDLRRGSPIATVEPDPTAIPAQQHALRDRDLGVALDELDRLLRRQNVDEFTTALADLDSKPHPGFADLRAFCTTWLAELEQHGWLTRRLLLADGSELDVGRLAKALGRLAELERANARNPEDHAPQAGHGPGVPGAMHLEAFGQTIADAFGTCPYHVGSSATGKAWRDVDVRLILNDDQFHALFPGFATANHIDAWWSLLCAALSELGRKRTGLPIDFQIQSMTEANAKYPGIRNPLMLIHARDEHRPAMAADPTEDRV